MSEFFLYCEDGGKCVLKQDGYETTHEFADVSQALSYLQGLKGHDVATLTVYDGWGNVKSRDAL